MCISTPKVEAPPPPAQMQAMQQPKEMAGASNKNALRRRGMWASIFTSPQGITSAPNVTGTSGGVTGA